MERSEATEIALDTASTRRPALRMSPGLRQRVVGWALEEAPGEACGLLLGYPGRAGAPADVVHVVVIENLLGGPRYRLDPEGYRQADAAARRRGWQIVGIWHSHPSTPPRPSAEDLETAWESFSYVIVGLGDHGAELRSWRVAPGTPRRFVEEEWLP